MHAVANWDHRSFRDLMARLYQGLMREDEDAWEELVRTVGPMVLGVLHRLNVPRDAQSDILQDVWCALHEGLHRIRNPEGLWSWIKAVAHHQARRHAERSQRQSTDLSLIHISEPTRPY